MSASREGLDGDYINLAFGGLFVVVGLIGVRTLMQLILLRKAWFDSVKAMNRIKRYYIEKNGDLGTAFRWMDLPPGFKPMSVSFLMALQTAVLSSAAFGVAAVFIVRHLSGDFSGSASAGDILIAVGTHPHGYYKWSLSRLERSDKAIRRKMVHPGHLKLKDARAVTTALRVRRGQRTTRPANVPKSKPLILGDEIAPNHKEPSPCPPNS